MYRLLSIIVLGILALSLLVSFNLSRGAGGGSRETGCAGNEYMGVDSYIGDDWVFEKGYRVFSSGYVWDVLGDRVNWSNYVCSCCVEDTVWVRVKLLEPLDPMDYTVSSNNGASVYVYVKFTIYRAQVLEVIYGDKSLEGRTIYVLSSREIILPSSKKVILSDNPPLLPGKEYVTYVKKIDKRSLSYYIVTNGSMVEREGIELNGDLYRLGGILMVFIVVDNIVYNIDTLFDQVVWADKDYSRVRGVNGLVYSGSNILLKEPLSYSEFRDILIDILSSCKQ